MNDQLDLTGNAHTIIPGGKTLTERQQLCLNFIRAHAPVPSDELGALLHQHRQRNGGLGHSEDSRCKYCGDEGSQMGRRLRELGLVREARGLGWYDATKPRPGDARADAGGGDPTYNELPPGF